MNGTSLEAGSRFIASTMHEVRTPLQTIIGTLELLMETPLNEEQQEYIHQIEFSASALLGLANDVLDFTKITSNNFNLDIHPFDVIELTERVVDLITVEAFNNDLEVITDIDYNIPHSVVGDSKRIQQIILNLVKNATKFTEKGFVMVRLTKKNEIFVFEVIDSGIGVSDDQKKLIFQDFYQIDGSSARKVSGTGLGLSICKNLINIMGGKIGVLSNQSGGSDFWFTLPLEEAQYKRDEPISGITDSTRILIVDDNSLAAKAMRSHLEYFGVRNIEMASSISSAIGLLQSAADTGSPFTAAFLDFKIRGEEIFSAAEEIRKNPKFADLILYLMIPEGQMKKDSRGKTQSIFTGFIYKPVKYAELERSLRRMFSPKEIEAETIEQIDPSTEQKLNSIMDAEIASGLKILVAEDQPVNRKLLETFLKKFGAEVILAEDGVAAIAQIKAHPEIDLVFMDIFMPNKTGIDATVEARSFGYKGIIIACTANNDSDDFSLYKQVGMNDIIIKPFKKMVVRDAIEKWKSFLSVPNAKNILSLTLIKDASSEMWDLEDFMDTVGDNAELAVSIMGDYITQTDEILGKISAEQKKAPVDFEKLKLYSHTLKGSSAAISANRFADLGKRMNDSAKRGDIIEFEAARINFALDFITFKNLVENWKTSV